MYKKFLEYIRRLIIEEHGNKFNMYFISHAYNDKIKLVVASKQTGNTICHMEIEALDDEGVGVLYYLKITTHDLQTELQSIPNDVLGRFSGPDLSSDSDKTYTPGNRKTRE